MELMTSGPSVFISRIYGHRDRRLGDIISGLILHCQQKDEGACARHSCWGSLRSFGACAPTFLTFLARPGAKEDVILVKSTPPPLLLHHLTRNHPLIIV